MLEFSNVRMFETERTWTWTAAPSCGILIHGYTDSPHICFFFLALGFRGSPRTCAPRLLRVDAHGLRDGIFLGFDFSLRTQVVPYDMAVPPRLPPLAPDTLHTLEASLEPAIPGMVPSPPRSSPLGLAGWASLSLTLQHRVIGTSRGQRHGGLRGCNRRP